MASDLRPAVITRRVFLRSLIGSLAVAPAFFFCTWFYYQTTDFVYGPLSHEGNAVFVRGLRWSIFGGLILILVCIVAWLKIRHPKYGNNPYSLFILLPAIAFVAFSNWVFGLLVFGLLAGALVFSQLFMVVVRDKFRTPPAGWGDGADRLASLRFMLLAVAVGLGIWLMISARSWAYASRQLEEIKRRDLYSEPKSLQQLAEGDHKEYVYIAVPGVSIQAISERTFGSGDDSYKLRYGMLTDKTLELPTALEWRLWVYLPYYFKQPTFPMVFQVTRCTVGTDCPANLLKMRETVIQNHFLRLRMPSVAGVIAAKNGQVLAELTPQVELVRPRAEWVNMLTVRAWLLMAVQVAYAFVHFAELMLLSRRLRQEYPQG